MNKQRCHARTKQQKGQSLEKLQSSNQLKIMTNEETKEYHLKKLYELSLKSNREKPQLEEPTYEQKEWVIGKMKAPAQVWKRWFVALYFTEEQKRELGLTDKDIAGKGMA